MTKIFFLTRQRCHKTVHVNIVHIQWSRKWGREENVIALWKDGRGMQAVEIEATGVHQTPSSLVEWCADTAGCKQCVLPKCTRGGKWSLSLLAWLLESYLIFMGNDTAGPQGNWTILSKTAVPFIPSLTEHADLNVKYIKSLVLKSYVFIQFYSEHF